MYANVRQEVGESITYEGLMGNAFSARVVAEAVVGAGGDMDNANDRGRDVKAAGAAGEKAFPGVYPEITGSAKVTGFNTVVLDDRDALRNGFLV